MSKLVITAIAKMKDNIHKSGIKIDGKGGSRFGDIHSEASLIRLMREHKPEGLDWIFINGTNTAAEQTASGRMIVTTASKMIFTIGNDMVEFDMVGVGSDMNDASFAQGKANTYSKRYFLLKLLDLTNDNLDPEKPEALEKELRQALTDVFAKDEALADKVNVSWKAKYGVDLDVNKLNLEQLQRVYGNVVKSAPTK